MRENSILLPVAEYGRSAHHAIRIISVLALGFALSACVGSKVSETLDVAAMNAPTDLAAVEETTLEDEAVAAHVATLEQFPVPSPSPNAVQAPDENPIMASALINESESAAAADAAQSLLADNGEGSEEIAEATLETASLGNESVTTNGGIISPQPARQASAVSTQPKKPGGLFGLLFGNNKKSAKATVASLNGQKTPKTKTTVTAPPSEQDLNTALPGVKRNSVIFGIEEEDGTQNVQVASIGSLGRTLSPSGLILQTERVKVDCFKPELLRILAIVERKYGKKVMVTSGYRSPKRNRRAGGARNSTHIYCKAADIQVEGVSKWDLAKFLRTVPGRGGVGTYCRTKSVHVDVGSQRDWHHPCRRSKRKRKA